MIWHTQGRLPEINLVAWTRGLNKKSHELEALNYNIKEPLTNFPYNLFGTERKGKGAVRDTSFKNSLF